MARFACATWRPISVNYGGNVAGYLGAVLHHQGGNGGLYGWFNNPSAKVSAHFWIAKNGLIEQYVDTSRQAWHGMSLNSRYVGVETEGCPPNNPTEDLTQAQINAFGRLYAEGARVHGWANALANADGQRGLGYHRMAVNTACPTQARLNRRGEILRIAFSGQAPPSTAPPSGGGGTQAPKFSATPYFDQRTNSRHPDVKTWQSKMRSRGWGISADGIYGPQSEDACRKFQREKGLSVDGKVGPQTWSTTWTAPVT
jgi:hypothetical protein